MLLKRWDSDLGTTFSMTSNTALRKRKRKEQPRLDRPELTKGVRCGSTPVRYANASPLLVRRLRSDIGFENNHRLTPALHALHRRSNSQCPCRGRPLLRPPGPQLSRVLPPASERRSEERQSRPRTWRPPATAPPSSASFAVTDKPRQASPSPDRATSLARAASRDARPAAVVIAS